MLSIEIKVNNEIIKELYVVRREEFKGWGYLHEYDAGMIERVPNRKPDIYPMGKLKHRYCAGAVSLAEKMLKLARQKGMHR